MIQPPAHATGIISSWIPEVRWVSRHDVQDTKVAISEEGIPDSSLSLSSSLSTTAEDTSDRNTYDTLLSELNQIKEQLMPSAKACADAINTFQSSNTTNPGYEFRIARSTCNPYESLGTAASKNYLHQHKKKSRKRKHHQQTTPRGFSRFVNRSAIKLANIDALLGFVLTTPVPKDDDTFIFVDLCGAPGGFSEYILYRSLHPAITQIGDPENDDCRVPRTHIVRPCVGFGMSLNGENSDGVGLGWDLDHIKRYHMHYDDVLAANEGDTCPRMMYHVCDGADGTGSIYNWDNVVQLQHDIRVKIDSMSCRNPLANLVVADGGFDAQRDSTNQESMAFKIIACQTAAALTLLRPEGTYVLKMFGFREDATRKMLNFLHSCFDQLTFVKPILSRPASAERYLVCRGFVGVGLEWNGLEWRDNILLGCNECIVHKCPQLKDLMTSFDLEMAQLNIDSCRSIVDYLKEKRIWVEQGNDLNSFEERRSYLDPSAYESVWQLTKGE